MIYFEIKKDLFRMSGDYYLAHCISSDLAMGAGIAVQFEKRFNLQHEIHKVRKNNLFPDCVLTGRVFNLITKNRYWGKPTYKDLTDALIKMRSIADKEGITKIAMPKIGSGLDKLNWLQVQTIILDVFKDMDIEIVVCYI